MPESLGREAAHTLCLREVQMAMLGSGYPGRTPFTPGRRGWLDLRVVSCRELREAGVNLAIFPFLWFCQQKRDVYLLLVGGVLHFVLCHIPAIASQAT